MLNKMIFIKADLLFVSSTPFVFFKDQFELMDLYLILVINFYINGDIL